MKTVGEWSTPCSEGFAVPYLSNTSLLDGDQTFPSFYSPTIKVEQQRSLSLSCLRKFQDACVKEEMLVSLFTSSIDKMFVPTTKYE